MLETSDSMLTVPEINIKQKWVSVEEHAQHSRPPPAINAQRPTMSPGR